jgi:dynein heavy chain, axonemal
VNQALYDYLISIQVVLNEPAAEKLEDWIPLNRWIAICKLAEITPGWGKNIITSFSSYTEQWQNIYDSNTPEEEMLPIKFQDLTPIEKVAIIKAIRPDKMIPAIKKYIIQVSGEQFINPPPFDLNSSFADSSNQTPLIFVLPGADPQLMMQSFAQQKNKLDKYVTISLG